MVTCKNNAYPTVWSCPKYKHTAAILSSYTTTVYIPNGAKVIIEERWRLMCIYHAATHNSQVMESP
jgi:hypothetical protein